MCSSALLYGTTTGAITLGPILNEIHITVTLSVRKRQKCQKTPTIRSSKPEASNYCHPEVQQVWWVVAEYLDIIKYKPSAFFRKFCDSCMSVHAFSFLHGCTHLSLGLRPGCRTVSNNGSGSGLAPAQNILAIQVWFGFT